MNLVLRQMLTRNTFRICEGIRCKPTPLKFMSITSNSVIRVRYYSDEKSETKKLPLLMDFPPILYPSIIQFFKNWLFSNFIIRPYFENDFNITEFIEASKHAVQVVSESLQKSDFKSLEGLVEKDAISSLKAAISKLSVSQRQMLTVEKDDIFYAFPYQIGVMFDDSDKRWVEITMCYHVLRGLKSLTDKADVPLTFGLQPEYQDRMFILNYRFIREFTKGVEDSWWVNIVNHFQPKDLRRQ